jgi:dihydrofolate reductase
VTAPCDHLSATLNDDGRLTTKLTYTAIASLDGFIEDEHGNFDWAFPGPDVHAFVNQLESPVGLYLYGRRMYETMVFWETQGGKSAVTREYAQIWRAADKIVFSRTLQEASSARTKIERELTADVIRRLKESSPTELSIGGAELGGQAITAGLVDELRLLLAPVIVGAGKPALPAGIHSKLQLNETRTFANGFVYLSYRFQA